MRFLLLSTFTNWSVHSLNLLTAHRKSYCYITIGIAATGKFIYLEAKPDT